MASSLRRKMGSSRWLRESGNVIVGAPFMVIGLLMGFGVTYSGYRVYQENIEQDRRARSIGLAALKAYDLAGCEYDHVNRNAGRVRFAVDAARRAMDVENVESMPLPSISIPAGGTSGPIEAVFEDSTGGTRGKVTLRLGSVDDMSDGTLGVLKPCVAATTYLNLTTPQVDDWLPNQPFQASLIPADFDWRTYLATYPDLTAHNPPLDTEAEARRHFALYGVHEAGRTVWTPRHREAHEFIAAEVTVHGLSSTDRSGQFAKLFGVNSLSRSTSKVVVVRDVGVQSLQVGEIEIGSNPPAFRKPVLDRSKVSYTMSMDVLIERTGTGWRNIFNSGNLDCCDPTTRRPAVFISGTDLGSANRVHIVHGASAGGGNGYGADHDGNNRYIVTSFAATPGAYFNLTWTVHNGTLTTYINGIPDPTGVNTGSFTWAEENWRWNGYLTQFPSRIQNTAGSVKVKNVLWWNRPLSPGEVQTLQGARAPQVHFFEVP